MAEAAHGSVGQVHLHEEKEKKRNIYIYICVIISVCFFYCVRRTSPSSIMGLVYFDGDIAQIKFDGE